MRYSSKTLKKVEGKRNKYKKMSKDTKAFTNEASLVVDAIKISLDLKTAKEKLAAYVVRTKRTFAS